MLASARHTRENSQKTNRFNDAAACVMLGFGREDKLTKDTLPQPKRAAVLVFGVVQGVGFRPFVYRLAFENQLAGFIGNDTDGVTIEVEGAEEQLAAFVARLRSDAPPMARIDSVAVRDIPATGEHGFRIVSSQV